MDDYVKRQDVLARAYVPSFSLLDCSDENFVIDADDVHNLPAAEVRPVVHGKWVERRYWRPSTMDFDCIMYACSECGNELSYDAETGMWVTNWSFCPNCGADMRKLQ